MKKVLIIGATGSLATVVTEALQKQKDVQLTLFARNTSRLRARTGVTLAEGDALNYDSVKNAVADQDIIYVNLAGDLEAMTANIVRAMQETGVKRIIAISSIGIYVEPVKPILRPYRALADMIETSGLDYTILRPDWFTNANEVAYAITMKGEAESGSAVSRLSIATFIGTIVTDPSLFIRENVGISKPK